MRKYLDKELCEKLCSYYKPSKKEDLSCMGLTVITRLAEKGRKISIAEPNLPLNKENMESVEKIVCTKCPFYEDSCDFVYRTEGALPCGGFIFICDHISKKNLTIDDIRNIV